MKHCFTFIETHHVTHYKVYIQLGYTKRSASSEVAKFKQAKGGVSVKALSKASGSIGGAHSRKSRKGIMNEKSRGLVPPNEMGVPQVDIDGLCVVRAKVMAISSLIKYDVLKTMLIEAVEYYKKRSGILGRFCK